MITPERCARMVGKHMLAGHDGTSQVDRRDAVESFLGDLVQRGIAPGDAHSNIVVQDIDPAPSPPGRIRHCGQRLFVANVGFERRAFPSPHQRHCHRFLGGENIIVDREHPGPFLSEAQHRGAPISHSFTRRLSGADHDGDLVLQTHACLPSLADAPAYGRLTEKTRSGCCVVAFRFIAPE